MRHPISGERGKQEQRSLGWLCGDRNCGITWTGLPGQNAYQANGQKRLSDLLSKSQSGGPVLDVSGLPANGAYGAEAGKKAASGLLLYGEQAKHGWFLCSGGFG